MSGADIWAAEHAGAINELRLPSPRDRNGGYDESRWAARGSGTTGELVDRERDHLGALTSFEAIVLPRKSYTRVIQRDEAFVRLIE
jgi:hypothetical protein